MKWAIYILVLLVIVVLVIVLISYNTSKKQNIKDMNNNNELMLSDSGWFQYTKEQGWQKVSFDIKNNDVLNVIDANTLCTSIGKWVKIEGLSETRQTGAIIAGHDYCVWIDKLDYWPKHIEGQKVQVIGVLDERYDLPVFVPEPNEPVMHGIPVPEGTDLHEASRRYVLQDAIVSFCLN